MTARVFCVLRSGGDFDTSDVIRLKTCLSKHLPGYELHCLSDVDVPCQRIPLVHGWPRWWSKMELFRPDIEGDIFYLDLDTVIVGDIRHLPRRRQADVLLSDFYYPWRPGSGIMYLTEQSRIEVWQNWFPDAEYNMMHYYKGDQTFLATTSWAKTAERWQKLYPDQIISFKRHMRPAPPFPPGPKLLVPPKKARIVCFHGIPRPAQINASWVKEAWSE